MAQGVGISYNADGARILKIERSDEGLSITGIAAGLPGENLEALISENEISLDDSSIAFGLRPGDFLTSSIKREEGMDDSEIREHLRWEIERKIISDAAEYNFDYSIIGDTGFVFAGRKKLIGEVISSIGDVFTDVEPVALFNGCEGAGEINDGIVMLTSIEASGISSVVVEGGMPVAMESFLIKEDELSSSLAGLNQEDLSNIDTSTVERLAGYVFESINRLTSLGENSENPTPEKLILAGSGVYAGELADLVEKKSSLPAVISNPFVSIINDIEETNPGLAGKNAAFTSCFGLALRAMEV